MAERIENPAATREGETSELLNLQTALNDLSRVRDSLASELASARDQLDAAQTCIADKNRRLSRKSHLLAELQRASEIQIRDLQREVADLQSEASNLRREVSDYRRRISAVESSFAWRLARKLHALSAKYPRIGEWARHGTRWLWWALTLQRSRIREQRRLGRERRLLAASSLFDREWYLSRYQDVADAGWDATTHYLVRGAAEGRNPGPNFDTAYYLYQNPDVAACGINPLVHFLQIGSTEGRKTRPPQDGTAKGTAPPDSPLDYNEWIRRYDTLHAIDIEAIRRHILGLTDRPLISVLMPVYNPKLQFLRRALDSVLAQLYPNWELCIADDASTNPDIRETLEEYEARDHRIKVVYRTTNGHISAASNSALELVSGQYIALLDHDDELTIHALYMVAVELNEHPGTDILYSDEDKIDANGHRSGPYFKTDWDPDLFYCHNMVSHLGVYRTALVQDLGGFREGYEGSQDYDLVLRLLPRTKPHKIRHIPHVLYHWRLGEGISTFSTNSMEKAVAAARRSLTQHFEHLGRDVRVTASNIPYWNRVNWVLPDSLPRVSLIVSIRSSLLQVRDCLEDLPRKTDYPNLQVIIVTSGSPDPSLAEYLASLNASGHVLFLDTVESPTPGGSINVAAARADGDVFGFVDSNIEVLDGGWLKEMVSQVIRTEVGAVGAKLYDHHDRIESAGMVLGMTGIAGYGERGLPRSATGYFGRLQLVHGVSSVSSACMLVRRSVFQEVGGFDEVNLNAAYNDVDFCLRVRQAGYSVVWTPYAELYYAESGPHGSDCQATRDAQRRPDELYMEQRWADELESDPFYSPNLSLDDESFSLAFPPRLEKTWAAFIPSSLNAGEQRVTPDGGPIALAAQLADAQRLARQQALTLQRLQRQMHTSTGNANCRQESLRHEST